MKNKKGFTLIELLAVISILAILVIIALPRIVKIYEESQINIFKSEAKSFYKSLESEILKENLSDRTKKLTKNYSSIESEGYSKIPMEGRKLTYCAKVVQNKVVSLQVSNGAFQLQVIGKTDINLEDIEKYIIDSIYDGTLEVNGTTPEFTNCSFTSSNAYEVKKLAEKIKTADIPKSDSAVNFSDAADTKNESGLFYTSDLTKTEDSKVVYYYRGIVENNYVLFAELCFRIVRINEDGSIRLRYDGEPLANGHCPQTFSSSQKGINSSAYSYGKDTEDNAYVGYMFGQANQTNYASAHTNTNDSNAKDIIDEWYRTNIVSLGTDITSKVANAVYCNDRSIGSGGTISGGYTFVTKAYAKNNVLYGAARRITPSQTPSSSLGVSPQFKCPSISSTTYYGSLSGTSNNKFTLKTTSGGTQGYGNNKLDYPVALLTADEVVYAGGQYKNSNQHYYLATTGAYTTMTPAWYTNTEQMYIVNNGDIGVLSPYYKTSLYPVISLDSEVLTGIGNGNYDSPYQIKLD